MESGEKLQMFECNKCKKQFSEENETTHFRNSYYHLCRDCIDKNKIERQLIFYQTRLKTLPPIFKDIEDKYNMLERAREVKSENLYLYGATGSGKSVFATFILKENWKENKEGIFISFAPFIRKLQTNFEESDEEINYIKQYDGCLVIDDFGVPKTTDFVRLVSYEIIDYREQYLLQTIITSNFTLNQIDLCIDSRISSRITGMCGKNNILEFEGDKRINK